MCMSKNCGGSKPKPKMKATSKPYTRQAATNPFGTPKVRLSFSSRSR